MKKIGKGFLSALFLLSFLLYSANAASEDFIIKNGILMEYHGPGGAVVIPDGVTRLQDTFRYNDTITSITLPDGLTEISSAAFEQCKKLSFVKLPEGLLEIGDLAFIDCEKLESIVIPDSVQTIGRGAFARCSSLRSVNLPSTAKVDSSAFESTPWGEENATVIREGMREQDVIYHTDKPSSVTEKQGDFILQGSVLISYQGSGGKVAIPEGIIAIGAKAFYQNTQVTGIQVPDSLRTIGVSAFEGCTALETVSPLPDGFQSIAERAFYGCTNLTNFDKPNGVSIAHDSVTGSCDVFTGTRFEWTFGDFPMLENAFPNSRSYAGGFSDVKPGTWYYNNAVFVYETNLMEGKSTSRFDPDGTITVAETIKLAATVRAIGTGSNDQIQNSQPWYKTYYEYLDRYTPVDFQNWQEPNRPVSRKEFAYFMYQAFPIYLWNDYDNAVPYFPDLQDPNDVASVDYLLEISVLCNAGILTGASDGKFHPDRTITRAEAAAVVARIVDPLQRVNPITV